MRDRKSFRTANDRRGVLTRQAAQDHPTPAQKLGPIDTGYRRVGPLNATWTATDRRRHVLPMTRSGDL